MIIRPFAHSKTDSSQICALYNHFIDQTVITFEQQALSVEEMTSRLSNFSDMCPVSVCEDAGHVVGYAYASLWKQRSAYRHSAETSIYLHPHYFRRGLGKQLYQQLLADLFRRDFHVALACITLPNAASIALHESLGFRKVAHFNEVGLKFDQWLDVGYWQKLHPDTRSG